MDLTHLKRKYNKIPSLPPELWICIFRHATHVPGILVPEIYDHASIIGPVYNNACKTSLRTALITKRALVRVCKEWWHLAIPYLYQSVYIGRVRCLSPLWSTLAGSAAGNGTLVSTRPLGQYTERLDVATRDHIVNPDTDYALLATIISYMPRLAVASFNIATSFAGDDLPENVLDALRCSATSLRVFDWPCTQIEPPLSQVVDFVSKCTQLRVLSCPRLVWSKALDHGGFPPTLTTLRLQSIIPVHIATPYRQYFPHYDPFAIRRPGPTALKEFILNLQQEPYHWADLLRTYSSQLISVSLCIPNTLSMSIEHMEVLSQACPSLRRLTITSERYSSFIRPNLAFPSISYLGLRATRIQSTNGNSKRCFRSWKS